MTAQLTERAKTVLDAVRAASKGAWIKRTAIAAQMGKRTLSAADIAMLEILSLQGYIEAEESTDTRAPSGRFFRYRVKD